MVLRLGVQPVFIPEARPQWNGAVEHFNSWFHPLLLRQTFPDAKAVRRELHRLVVAANEQHVHQGLGFKTPAQFRQGKRLRKLPADLVIDFDHLPVTVGKITFIRWVLPTGSIDILGESIKVGRRFRHRYVKVLLETHPQRLRIYCNGHLIAQRKFALRIP